MTAPVLSVPKITSTCNECGGAYILDSAWKRADKELQKAWRNNGVPRCGAAGICVRCEENPSPRNAKVTGRCFECSGVYVLDHAWSTASEEQREAWTSHGVVRHGEGGVCGRCAGDCEAKALAVVDALYVGELEALDQRIAGGQPATPKPSLDGDWAAQLAREDLSPEMSLVRVLAELTASLAPAPGRWVREGLCRQFDVDFLDKARGTQAEAKSICRSSCPVRNQCLDYALRNPDGASEGVWGGETQKSLERIRRDARIAAYEARGIEVPTFGNPNPEYLLSSLSS